MGWPPNDLSARELANHIIGVLCGEAEERFSCKKESPGLLAEQKKQSISEKPRQTILKLIKLN